MINVPYKRNIRGVGYDSKGTHAKVIAGTRKKTKVYQVWSDMIRRGYSAKYKEKHTTYKDVVVCEEWHDLQVFGDWFVLNYKKGFCLDKDILLKGCKVYQPSTCRFIPVNLNLLLTNRVGKSRNTTLPLGVCKGGLRFTAWCNNGKGKTINLGTRDTPKEASLVYKGYKEKLIGTLAEVHYLAGDIDLVTRDVLLSYKVTD